MNMTKEKTFSELLHGDTLWLKQQEAVRRSKGRTVLVLDAEASVSYMTPSHYEAHDMLVRIQMGYGRGMHAKRKMIESRKVVAKINERHPALAAEHRVGGMKAERSIALEMKRLREWKKLNWAYDYGMAQQWKDN